MIDLAAIRNASAEIIGAPVQVSATRCQVAGISAAYADLFGIVIGLGAAGECLVSLHRASHRRFLAIESKAFSEPFRDSDADQWFCSGVLEVVK